MLEFCEVINVETIASRVISVESAIQFFTYYSHSIEDDDEYTENLEKAKELIEESFVLDQDEMETGLSSEEAKVVFDKELKAKVVFDAYRFGKVTFQEQFVSYFKIYDMGDTGCIGQGDFEHIMR